MARKFDHTRFSNPTKIPDYLNSLIEGDDVITIVSWQVVGDTDNIGNYFHLFVELEVSEV